MKLLTKEILDAFKKQGYTGDKTAEEIRIVAKFFGGGACSWYLYEYDPRDRIFMAYVNLGDPLFAECGSVSLDELEAVKFPPFGLPIERDMSFKPLSMTLAEVQKIVQDGGHV